VLKQRTNPKNIVFFILAYFRNYLLSGKIKSRGHIVKPSNIQYLEETIRNLSRNRETLRDHYASELPNDSPRASSSKKLTRSSSAGFSPSLKIISPTKIWRWMIFAQTGIPRMKLYRKVKAVPGLNINDYILGVGIQKAKYLWLYEDLPVSEIFF
jgi:hypothetical protein